MCESSNKARINNVLFPQRWTWGRQRGVASSKAPSSHNPSVPRKTARKIPQKIHFKQKHTSIAPQTKSVQFSFRVVWFVHAPVTHPTLQPSLTVSILFYLFLLYIFVNCCYYYIHCICFAHCIFICAFRSWCPGFNLKKKKVKNSSLYFGLYFILLFQKSSWIRKIIHFSFFLHPIGHQAYSVLCGIEERFVVEEWNKLAFVHSLYKY